MSAIPLTSHLYSLSTSRPYSAATEHRFLTTAGNGTLSAEHVSLWLAQDRLYAAHAYPRFIGLLLASVPFSSRHPLASPQEALHKRIVALASYALTNVVREVNFFGDTAKQFGLDLGAWKERKETRDYTAEMIRVGATGSVEDMLVFLWAMERVYLDAWKYVRSTASSTANVKSSNANDAIRSFVDNWTNAEFEKFVDDLAALVDALDIKPGSEAWLRAEEIWGRVVELEECFWPQCTEEELTALSVKQK
ncbi:heme oxygenase-like protein [Phanerochaete sordida]|uniref:Heme oxygenase-like protein n=1 Tax=Phanerochaete sordida TaxID=48140 RepID=A0A9P3GHT8_9APHY|nr:heme oxygenase-like protein [Phanerochaete sordida]